MDRIFYERLLTSGLISTVNVNPTTPVPNSALPTLFYVLLTVERLNNMNGTDGLRKCQYAVDVFSFDPTEVTTILDAVEAVLLPWRDTYVQGVFSVNRVQVPDDDIGGYHGQCVVDVWWNGTLPPEESSSSSSP